MKKIVYTALVVCLVLAVLPVAAAPTKTLKLVRLEGWIVDEHCGAKNANAEGKEDTLACHKKGAPLAFVSSKGDVYRIHKPEQSLDYVGEEIRVFGSIDDDDVLRVGEYIRLNEEEDTAGGEESAEKEDSGS